METLTHLDVPRTLDTGALARSIWSVDDLPDTRLYDRVIRSAGLLVERLESPTTQMPRAPRRGFQRLVRNPRVDAEALRAKANAFGMEAIRAKELVLVAHDTSEIDLHGSDEPADAGVLRSSQARGYLVHSALAVDPETDRIVALLDSHAWTRRGPLRHKDHKSRRSQDRESAKWRRGVRRVHALADKAGVTAKMVHLFDSEGATHETFRMARKEKHSIIARVSGERRIAEGDRNLWSHLAAQPSVATWTTTVRTAASKAAVETARKDAQKAAACEVARVGQQAERAGLRGGMSPSEAVRRARKARLAELRCVGDAAVAEVHAAVHEYGVTREAHLQVRYASVTLTPKDGRKPVRVDAVYFQEVDPPEHVEPVEWMLLTTCTVQTIAAALQMGRWYRLRYPIEEIHKVFKTGLHMEDEPFDNIRSFRRFLAIAGPVATQIMAWRECARTDPQAQAEGHVDAETLAMLKHACRYHHLSLPRRAWTIQDVIVRLAQLGGYERRPDRQPGWLVIWRGHRRLQEFADVYAYAKSTTKIGQRARCVPK